MVTTTLKKLEKRVTVKGNLAPARSLTDITNRASNFMQSLHRVCESNHGKTKAYHVLEEKKGITFKHTFAVTPTMYEGKKENVKPVYVTNRIVNNKVQTIIDYGHYNAKDINDTFMDWVDGLKHEFEERYKYIWRNDTREAKKQELKNIVIKIKEKYKSNKKVV